MMTSTSSALSFAAALAAVVLFLGFASPALGAGRTMTVDVDATDIARRLVSTRVEIPVEPGPVDLYYIEWTPGNHNPSGPIQNVVEFRVRDGAGRPLEWRRDPAHVVRHMVTAPPGTRSLVVEFTYIANQPSTISRSTDTYGRRRLGGLNWNTVLVYPGGASKDELLVRASLRLPEGWRAATSLVREDGKAGATEHAGGVVRFRPAPLSRLVDSPVILGEHLSSVELASPEGVGPHVVHAVAGRAGQSELPAKRAEKFSRMLEQTAKVFGVFPWSRFDFLVLLSDEVPGLGVEHTESTYVSMGARAFETAESGGDGDDAMTVMPHEYIHAWNGKLFVPEGLLHADYHTPAVTNLLWVYEGLTSYYKEVIAARCGLLTQEEFEHSLTSTMHSYSLQTGRLWRSVEDTAAAMRFLRDRSPTWEELRRRQDYYAEGGLFWMEVDAIIRSGTDGARSLDDFTLAFFSRRPAGMPATGATLDGRLMTYTRADVVAALRAVYDGHDWDGLIRRRIERPVETLELELPALLGRRLEFTNEPTERQRKDEKKSKSATLRGSIGLNADAEGRITTILRGSAADRAGLAYGMKIVTVEGRAYSAEALRDAVRESPRTGKVELLVNTDGESVEPFTLEYDGGMRYPRLTAVEGRRDWIGEIVRAR